jgi:hypothetical protein
MSPVSGKIQFSRSPDIRPGMGCQQSAEGFHEISELTSQLAVRLSNCENSMCDEPTPGSHAQFILRLLHFTEGVTADVDIRCLASHLFEKKLLSKKEYIATILTLRLFYQEHWNTLSSDYKTLFEPLVLALDKLHAERLKDGPPLEIYPSVPQGDHVTFHDFPDPADH